MCAQSEPPGQPDCTIRNTLLVAPLQVPNGLPRRKRYGIVNRPGESCRGLRAHSECLSDELKICSSQASTRPAAAYRRVMTSHQLHMRRDSACLQQRTDVARIAGQHDVRWSDQQRYVRVDDIGRASPREQLAYPLAVISA